MSHNQTVDTEAKLSCNDAKILQAIILALRQEKSLDSIDLESDDTYFFGIVQTHIDHFKIKDVLLDYSKDEKDIFIKYEKINLDQNVKLVVYLIKMEVEDNIIKNWTKIKEITPQIYGRSEN